MTLSSSEKLWAEQESSPKRPHSHRRGPRSCCRAGSVRTEWPAPSPLPPALGSVGWAAASCPCPWVPSAPLPYEHWPVVLTITTKENSLWSQLLSATSFWVTMSSCKSDRQSLGRGPRYREAGKLSAAVVEVALPQNEGNSPSQILGSQKEEQRIKEDNRC